MVPLPKSPLSAKNKTFYYGGHFEPEVKLTFSLKRLNFSNLDKKMSANALGSCFSYKEILSQRKLSKKQKLDEMI